jgi:S-methylmethionine-dependent homocysteine/selenocysteine methylase
MSDQALLPQLSAPLFIADGGLETTLVFLHGVDLPDFAAFPLLDDEAGREHLRRYYDPYLDIAERRGVGIVVDTPTWRANHDWAARLGYGSEQLAELNRRSVAFVGELVASRRGLVGVVNGVIGPRGDGYVVDNAMTASEAHHYHAMQARAFAEAGADMVTAVTMTYADEAIGVARATADSGLPVVISFTVETNGRLPSGQPLGEAVAAVDAATANGPAYYMVNCAHPTHFENVLVGGARWLERIKGVHANASRQSHAELDAAEELDRGDECELAADYLRLRAVLPDLRVVGGCCGTDHRHIDAISAAAVAAN